MIWECIFKKGNAMNVTFGCLKNVVTCVNITQKCGDREY